jgi:hypothetical protein
VIDRSAWSPRADYVCFDVGEQAAGMRHDAVPNSMHGHADCLSMVVWLGGRRVLADSGFYAYNCGGDWEAHFRETAAHNTARVDRRDQATHLGQMAWSHSYRAVLERQKADARQGWAIGSHDGFARGLHGVTHRRAFWRRPGYVLVLDEFVGDGEHEIEINYQFAPGTLERCGADGVVFDGFADLVWVGSGTWQAETRCGGPDPSDGWICPSLGQRQPAPRLTLRHNTTGTRTTLLTVIAHRLERDRRVFAVRDGSCCALVAVADADGIDWIGSANISAGGAVDTDALLAVCRMRRGEVLEKIGTDGTRVRVDAAALERLATSLQHVSTA